MKKRTKKLLSVWGEPVHRIRITTLVLISAIAQARAQDVPTNFDALKAAAQSEGTLNAVWSDSILGGGDVADQHGAKMNGLFNTHIKMNYTPGPEVARLGNQLFTELQAGQPASSDLYIGAAPQMLPLLNGHMFRTIAWQALLPARVQATQIERDSQVMRIQTGVSGVTYNTDLIAHPPSSIVDFLKPEWKGKIATTPYAGGYDILAANDLWGPAKTLDFVRKLSGQITGLMRCGDVERIATGEFPALVMDCISNSATTWQDRGAPIGFIIPSDAAQKRYYYIGIPRHARHPAAGTLFALYLMTPEGQSLMWETNKIDLDRLPGSHMAAAIAKAQAQGIKFNEITIDWWDQHPEIDRTKTEMIKLLTKQ